ncbi:DUF4465 domain-containing protein [Luteolibacter flavescens]|uniref:DUF4465 domain-containing protein n=1 Tax=Luteolibacter flavescens TaxID=1859460 RepID=A0ABT3FSB4_9BACT|nr:DUF4465 domain-containing protein [Luteolibacter flavescens]MCW1886442.1 DUF4465 domain-containing protein [Luteolibacter flavescens]
MHQPQKALLTRALATVPRPLLAVGITLAATLSTQAAVITFDDLDAGTNGYWNGSDGSGSFTTGGATFVNGYVPAWGSWSGFGYSNQGNTTTPGWGNQYSSYTGGDRSGSGNFTLAYGSSTVGEPGPSISFATDTNLTGLGAYFTNTTYSYLSMSQGDGFAKKFGGASGTDADYFKLTIHGYLNGGSTGTVDFYLADFRFESSAQDYIVDTWQFVDFSSLGIVDELKFSFDSSDVGDYGINTPVYFAMDDFLAVPEPSAALASLAGLALLARRRRR